MNALDFYRRIDEERMLCGVIAQYLFEELLRKANYIVVRTGAETILQHLLNTPRLTFDTHLQASLRWVNTIRHPDFHIGDPTVTDPKEYWKRVEVAFRNGEELNEALRGKIGTLVNYWEPVLVIVAPALTPIFQFSLPPYKESGKLVLKPLTECGFWKLDPDLYRRTEELAKKYLTL